tara:strand:- start:434 stop:754 length:321 start_codon:yes stop_codon:yes gene_type:complete
MKKNNFFNIIFFFITSLFTIPAHSDPIFELGKDVFLNKAVCSTCHTLADAESYAQIGPNLNEIRPNKMRVVTSVTNGIGVMPAYEGQLTPEEIDAVAHYVSIASEK